MSNNPGPRIICLDMDETVGSFGPYCIIVKIWNHFQKANPPVDQSIAHHLTHGAFRPYLKEFLLFVADLKKRGLIDALVLFTSASNAGGYVDHIVECLEYYVNLDDSTPQLAFDLIISNEYSEEFSRDGATIKDPLLAIKMLHEKTGLDLYQTTDFANVVFIDDKPYNIKYYSTTPSVCISMNPYRQYVSYYKLLEQLEWWNKEQADEWIKTTVPPGEIDTNLGMSVAAINHDLNTYPPQPWCDIMANDTDFLTVIDELECRFTQHD